jgi:flagellar hook-associated protein 3 FlgL
MLRISSLAMHTAGVNAMLKQQTLLARTQQQVASGKRVQTAADDPVAAVQLQMLDRLKLQQQQYASNSVALTNRLQLEEQALADSTDLLQRVRDLLLEANNDSMTPSDQQSVLAELRGRVSEMQSIANRRDNQNDYLFAGLSAATQPFVRDATGNMIYAGDVGARDVQIDTAVAVRDGDPGNAVFADTRQGNGSFVTAAASTNTGGGIIDTGVVVNASAWVPGSYTISFTAPDSWQVTDASSAVVATGSLAAGNAINFNGVQVRIDGTPATGDRFTVATAGMTSVFGTLDQLATALAASNGDDAGRAQLHSTLGTLLLQLDRSLEQIANTRSVVGARLSVVDDVSTTRDNRITDIDTSASQLRDLDYAAAVSAMNQQMVGLQAAQQSYSMLSKLSLFNFL